MAKIKSFNNRYITRIESAHTFGYWVRVRYNGAKREQFFSFSACGGIRAALAEARIFRDWAEADLGKPVTIRRLKVGSHLDLTERPYPGVRRLKDKRNVYWVVEWIEEPKKHPKRFRSIRLPVEQGQDQETLVKAIRIRRALEQAFYGQELLP